MAKIILLALIIYLIVKWIRYAHIKRNGLPQKQIDDAFHERLNAEEPHVQ
jgi:hypothetical protein